MILKLTEPLFLILGQITYQQVFFFFYYNIHVPVVRNVNYLKNLKIKKKI